MTLSILTSYCCYSITKSCLTLCSPMNSSPASLSPSHVHWVGDAIQPSHSLMPSFPPALNLSQDQGLFQWVSSLHHVARVLGFSFRVSPSNEYSGLISCRIDWFDFPAVEGTLKSLLQHHSSKPSILWCTAKVYWLTFNALSYPLIMTSYILNKKCFRFL